MPNVWNVALRLILVFNNSGPSSQNFKPSADSKFVIACHTRVSVPSSSSLQDWSDNLYWFTVAVQEPYTYWSARISHIRSGHYMDAWPVSRLKRRVV